MCIYKKYTVYIYIYKKYTVYELANKQEIYTYMRRRWPAPPFPEALPDVVWPPSTLLYRWFCGVLRLKMFLPRSMVALCICTAMKIVHGPCIQCTHVHAHACTHIFADAYACMYAYAHACLCTHKYVCAYACIYA